MAPLAAVLERDEGGEDGRVLRRAKTRAAVVEALLALLEEGVLRPTASQVAERAGVSLRSVGQNFGTQDQLFREAAAVVVARVAAAQRPVVEDGDRVVAYVAQRAAFAEKTANVRRAAAFGHASEVVDETGKLWRKARRAELERVFERELGEHDAATRRDVLRALECAVSASSWDELRQGMRLSRADAERAMVTQVRALVGNEAPRRRTRGGST